VTTSAAALLRAAARNAVPVSRSFGVAGPRMIDGWVRTVVPVRGASHHGLAEILKLPAAPCLRLRRNLVARLARRLVPDGFVGIDSPEFNLRYAAQ
jgi:lipid A disaccharide synthetase